MDTSITDFKILPLPNSKYLKPFRINFRHNGKERNWDCVEVFNSVAILLYHIEKDSFLLVKQFRPAVWYSQNKNGVKNDEKGYTYELCAGIMDKDLNHHDTVKEEVLEEVGYNIKTVEKISTCYTALGFGGSTQTMFYGEIDDSMKVSDGGGVDDEDIELIFVERKKMMDFIFDESKPKGSGLMFAYLWWVNKFKEN